MPPPLFIILGTFVLMKPSALWRFMLFCGLAFANSVKSMPDLTNHQMMALFINVALLIAGGCTLLRARNRENPSLFAYELFAPVLRVSLIAFYFWVVVHKINQDYFNADISCAWNLYYDSATRLSSRTGGLIPLSTDTALASTVVWVTLIFEALIPILLISARTRKAGILVGLGFHTGLALYPSIYVGTFSLLMSSQYALFVPIEVWNKVVERWRRTKTGAWLGGRAWRIPMVMATLIAGFLVSVLVLAIVSGGLDQDNLSKAIHKGSLTACTIIVIALMITMAVLIIRSDKSAWKQPLRGTWMPARYRFALIVPALVFLNGLSPYLGLKNENCFAMYSNLRTEAGVNNHFFIPHFDVLGNNDDGGVVVLASNDPSIPNMNEEQTWFSRYLRHRSQTTPSQQDLRPSWFTLRSKIGDTGPDFTLTYQRDGQDPVTVSRRDQPNHPVFNQPSLLSRTIRSFKPTPPNDLPCRCRH